MKGLRKKEFTPFAKGEYLGHIVEVETKMLDVRQGKYKARLYSFVVEVAEENKDKDFEFENIKGALCFGQVLVFLKMKFIIRYQSTVALFLEHNPRLSST